MQLMKSLRKKERKVCNAHLVFIEIFAILLINAYILIFLNVSLNVIFIAGFFMPHLPLPSSSLI
jgi:hypothetical protein